MPAARTFWSFSCRLRSQQDPILQDYGQQMPQPSLCPGCLRKESSYQCSFAYWRSRGPHSCSFHGVGCLRSLNLKTWKVPKEPLVLLPHWNPTKLQSDGNRNGFLSHTCHCSDLCYSVLWWEVPLTLKEGLSSPVHPSGKCPHRPS